MHAAAPGAGLALASLLMKNMIGAGIFALFTALTSSNTGLLPGLAILAAVAAASAMSFELLGEAAEGDAVDFKHIAANVKRVIESFAELERSSSCASVLSCALLPC